jgi:glycosyltransferase involved in cell wall biosynthesis
MGTELSAVIVLCQVYHPDSQSTSQLLSDVLAKLAERGRKMIVLSGYPGVYDGRRLAQTETWKGVEIRRGGMRSSMKKNLVTRVLTYLTYSSHVVWQLMRHPGRARVLVVTNPPFLPVLAWLVCSVRGHQFKLMLQDIYPDGLVAVGHATGGGAVDRLWRAANHQAFRQAREIWVLGRDMRELLYSRYEVAAKKIRIVPHWSPVEFGAVRRVEATRLHAELKISDRFVVQYSGNMGLWHDLQTVVRAAAHLRGDPSIVFLLIGQGRERGPAERLAGELGLQNIIWLPYQKRELLEDSLSCCHVALISQRAGLEGVAVPCKLYGILASGRAIIAQVPAVSEVAYVVSEERCGRVIAPGDVVGLAREIAALAADRATVTEMASRAHEAYRLKYTLATGADAFEEGLAEW